MNSRVAVHAHAHDHENLIDHSSIHDQLASRALIPAAWAANVRRAFAGTGTRPAAANVLVRMYVCAQARAGI